GKVRGLSADLLQRCFYPTATQNEAPGARPEASSSGIEDRSKESRATLPGVSGGRYRRAPRAFPSLPSASPASRGQPRPRSQRPPAQPDGHAMTREASSHGGSPPFRWRSLPNARLYRAYLLKIRRGGSIGFALFC